MDTFKASLDWLTFTYKPERSHWGAALKLDTLQHSREKLPIDYFMEEFPSVASFIKENGREIRGRFNYNFGYQVGVRSNGSYNANTDFVVLAVMCTDTASREYAVKQGVNVSVPGHYIPKFCELLGLEGDSDDSIALLFNFLRDHGCSASRIDLALDDFSKRYSAFWYGQRMMNGDIISNFSKYSIVSSLRDTGSTFYLGDRKKRYLRIYDKWYESKGEVDSVRYEIESHENYAKQLFNDICDIGMHFNFFDFLLQFLKISDLCPDHDEWFEHFRQGQFSEELPTLTIPKFNVMDQYIINSKFEESVYNFIASQAEFFGDDFVILKLHKARDNPTKRNKKLSAFYSNMDLNHSRGEFIRRSFVSYGENFN